MSTNSATWHNSCRVPDDHQGPVYSMKWDTTTRTPGALCRERRKTQQEICQVYESICMFQSILIPSMGLEYVPRFGWFFMGSMQVNIRTSHMGPSWDICLCVSPCSVKNPTSGESWGGFVILASWAHKLVWFSLLCSTFGPKSRKNMSWNRWFARKYSLDERSVLHFHDDKKYSKQA